jgi:hypothetical protein
MRTRNVEAAIATGDLVPASAGQPAEKSINKIVGGAKEALAVARGKQPAARIYMQGHVYVPASAVAEMRERCAKVAESWFGNTIGKVSLGPSAQDAIAGTIRQLDTASACGDYGAAPPFKVGDRVTHTGCQESGTVTSTENGLVVVEFDVPTPHGNISVGRYDAVWFRTYPNGLILHAASSNGGGK